MPRHADNLEGRVFHGLQVIRRCNDVKRVIVQCTYPGCTAQYDVILANVKTGMARRLCTVHREAVREAKRANVIGLPPGSAGVALSAAVADALVEPLQDQVQSEAAHLIARRMLAREKRWHWKGFALDGKTLGYHVCVGRTRTVQGGHAAWNCMCMVCGRIRTMWDNTLRYSGKSQRCECMIGERFRQAEQLLMEMREGGKYDVTDPRSLLLAGQALNRMWDSPADEKWCKRMRATIDMWVKLLDAPQATQSLIDEVAAEPVLVREMSPLERAAAARQRILDAGGTEAEASAASMKAFAGL